MNIDELIPLFQSWQEKLVELRLKNDENGRQWLNTAIGFSEPLTYDNIAKFFDRQVLNDEYVKRYEETDPNSKLPHTYVQAEIDIIYSFHKSFALRHKHRLGYYRDDLSQKGVHTHTAIEHGYATFKAQRDIAEKGNAQ